MAEWKKTASHVERGPNLGSWMGWRNPLSFPLDKGEKSTRRNFFVVRGVFLGGRPKRNVGER